MFRDALSPVIARCHQGTPLPFEWVVAYGADGDAERSLRRAWSASEDPAWAVDLCALAGYRGGTVAFQIAAVALDLVASEYPPSWVRGAARSILEAPFAFRYERALDRAATEGTPLPRETAAAVFYELRALERGGNLTTCTMNAVLAARDAMHADPLVARARIARAVGRRVAPPRARDVRFTVA